MLIRNLSALLFVSLCSFSFAVSQSNPVPPAPLATSTPASQETSSTVSDATTTLKATTRLVVVDVVATDSKGHAVTDLTAADFKLLENGREQKITSFNATVKTSSHQDAPLAASTPAVLPEGVVSNVPQYRVDGPLNIILLDSLNTSLPSQGWVRNRMLELLKKMPSDRPIAIYNLGSRLRLLQDFTSDPSKLKAAVAEYQGAPSSIVRNTMGGAQEMLPATVYSNLEAMGLGSVIEGVRRLEAEDTVHETDFQVQYTLDVLRTLAANLAAYPGRKNLIWISEGFPIELNAGDATNERRQGGPRNYYTETSRISHDLEMAQVSVYTIYAGGLSPDPLYSASNSGISGDFKPADVMANYITMHEIADRTGGLFFHNQNDLDLAVQASLDDGASYYVLGYYPQDKNWDGKFRKFKITARPGVKLRYRSGYVALDPASFQTETKKQRTNELSRFLNLDFPVSTGLLFKAAVLPPSEKNKQVLVNFLIDPGALQFESQADGAAQLAKVECAVEAYSSKGHAIKTVGHVIDTPLPNAAVARLMKAGFPCQQSIDLPPGNYILRLGVRDNNTGQIGTANALLNFTQNASAEVKKNEAQKNVN